MGIWAVLPVKETHAAKQRLAAALPPALRRDLAQAMAEDVLRALAAARGLDGIVVVTADPAIRDLALTVGATVLAEGARDGQSQAVEAARRFLPAGASGMLALPADIPLVTAAEIECVLAGAGRAPSFTIVPSRDGRGSNAVLCRPPDAVPPGFGGDSFPRHLVLSRARGIEPRVLRLPGIALDIDAPEDVARLVEAPSPTRSYALLAGAGVAA